MSQDKELDCADQLVNTFEHPALESILADISEEALHHIHPRSTGRSEVHVMPAGSKVRMRTTVTKIEDKNGGRLLTRNCIVEVQGPDGKIHDKPAIIAEWLGLVFPA